MGNCAVVPGKDLPSHRCSVGKGEAMLHCGCKIPVIPSACVSHDEKCNLPVMDGYVREFPVKVLRDSGCNGVVVRRSLVTESQLTGKSKVKSSPRH